MSQQHQQARSPLEGPAINKSFERELNELVALARKGHQPGSQYLNPSDEWLISRMTILQEISADKRTELLKEAEQINTQAEEAYAAGRAAQRAWPEVVVRLDRGGLAFFSQLGVVRRPDLTQYFIDGFSANRDALAFSEENQALFAEVFSYINKALAKHLEAGDTVIQTDRQVGDAPGRSFHARQMLFGARYLQIPIMWRQLTFDLPEAERRNSPDILEVSLPNWMNDLGLPEELKSRITASGITQLVFKAPTKGLSLHLGFDYVGEHKMGPLSVAMFLVKQKKGVAIQAALSMARVKTLEGNFKNTALLTVGPSLHGKSTLTIMIELVNSELGKALGLTPDPEEGVYPMNDDIVLLQRLEEPIKTNIDGKPVTISYGIDGTENNFYAMPFGLNQSEDPITFEAVRGTPETPNTQEILENVPIVIIEKATEEATPNFLSNPVRNMRVTLSRSRLVARKGAQQLIESMTNGKESDSVHVPMEYTDRVFWQAVMRQNTIIPPLRKLTLKQYIRVLMYGEAVQMGAAIGAIGRPYVEYFSDPFIIGLEDDNANLMYRILHQMENEGLPLEYYVFNTGGVGADTNDEASGKRYRKIPRELTLMLQEALLREAVKFEYDPILGSNIAVAIVDKKGTEVTDLRIDWLAQNLYGPEEYSRRMTEISRRRYYSLNAEDKAGILRYTKVDDEVLDLSDIPAPEDERALAWLMSFYWNVDQAYNDLADLVQHLHEGKRPDDRTLAELQGEYQTGVSHGLALSADARRALPDIGLRGVD